MFGITKNMFTVLSTSIVTTSSHRKCVSLSNQKSMTQPALGGITINDDVSVRNAIHVNKVMFGILSHIAVKIENI